VEERNMNPMRGLIAGKASREGALDRALRPAIVVAATLALLLLSSPSAMNSERAQPRAAPASEEAYFQFDYPPNPETFVFKLTDPTKIDEARAILSGHKPNRHVMGNIVKRPIDYNPPWSYHLDPASVTFFDFSIEVCDATIRAVEERLDEACGSFLPGCVWCPWGSRLIAEVKTSPTPTPTPAVTPSPTPVPTPTATPVAVLFLPVVLRGE
jgi:hypothetical protein